MYNLNIYKCGICGKKNVKLWRNIEVSQLTLRCFDCARNEYGAELEINNTIGPCSEAILSNDGTKFLQYNEYTNYTYLNWLQLYPIDDMFIVNSNWPNFS